MKQKIINFDRLSLLYTTTKVSELAPANDKSQKKYWDLLG